MVSRRFTAIGLSLAIGLAMLARSSRAATPEQIDEMIKTSIDYLYSQQNKENGSWETTALKPLEPKKGLNKMSALNQWGFRTALITYALLAAGESPIDPRIVKATDWLRKESLTGPYEIGMRANVWLRVPATSENKQAMLKDARFLVGAISKKETNAGLYNYQLGAPAAPDLLCSQYAVMGAWAAAQRTEVFKKDYWQAVEKAWRGEQLPTGEWSHQKKPDMHTDYTIQMTAAGIATLFITYEYLHSDDGIDGNKGNPVDDNITRGFKWIEENFQVLTGPKLASTPVDPLTDRLDAFHGVAENGMASGYKYFGKVDWFQAGADWIIQNALTKKGWTKPEDAAHALLFLSRGRAPVIINKLQYTAKITGDKSGSPREANWNQRPRDIASLARWAGEKTERTLNWQVVNLDVATVDELHDSTILYMSGNQGFAFSDEQRLRIKQYIDEGGILIGNADAGNADFTKAFRELGKQLFPAYEFAPLTDKTDIPVITGQLFAYGDWKRKPKVEILGNRARALMLLIPSDDFSRPLQKRDTNRNEVFELLTNVFLYSTDKAQSRYKGQTHIVRADPAIKAEQKVKVARLKYNGGWNPEPGSWTRLAATMNNQDKTELDLQTVELGKDSLTDFKIAHLTGAEKFTFTEDQRKAIKEFVAKDGLIIIDACGGAGDFNASVESELSKIFPGELTQIAEPLKPDHPIYTSGSIKQPEPRYRTYALSKLGSQAAKFRLRGLAFNNKLSVIYSPDDLSVGLVGVPVDGIIGMTPENVSLVVRRILQLKSTGKI